MLSKIKISSIIKLVPVLTILMEIIWLYAWLVWLGEFYHTWSFAETNALKYGDVTPHMNLISYVVLGLFTEFICRMAIQRKWSLKRIQLIVFPGIVILFLILFRANLNGGYGLLDTEWFVYLANHILAAIIAAVSGIYILWRGIATSRGNYLFQDVYRKFVIGLGFMIGLMVIWWLSGVKTGGIWSTVGIYTLSYFGVGLMALAITNLDTLSSTFTRHQESVASFRKRWTTMIIVLVLLILLAAVGLSSLFSTNIASSIGYVINNLATWILTGVTYLFWPLAFVAALLYYVGMFLISLITKGETPEFEVMELPEIARREKEPGQESFQLSAAAATTIKWVVFAIVVGAVLYFLFRFLSRYWQSKTEEGVEEEHESIWSWNLFRTDIFNFLVWLFPFLRRRKKVLAEGSGNEIEDDLRITDAGKEMNMREIYRSVIRRGRVIGVPRRKSETANEYSSRLAERKKTGSEELNELTEAYNYERYGEKSPDPEKLSFLNRLWRTLSSKLLHSGNDEQG